ncbi:MAG: fumarylacetoacetate hydrolase family protein [Candidatus Hydrogenedentes bacterium]|nr:fumarylacetoacetate hydrolase family protein [Candidatus Hydrogenedentota bacterium]
MPTQSVYSLVVAILLCGLATAQSQTTKYVRYAYEDDTAYGVLQGNTIQELQKNFLESTETTGRTIALADVKLLAPVEPRKVFAVGFNYQSHLGSREVPETPPIFLKLPTCIVGPGDDIVIPEGARAVQYEAELVLVIGKTAKNVSVEEARDHIFGVTCGNDVSARAWQQSDLQWFRGKAPDTFGPIGPCVVTGLDYDDLLLQGRLNGETGQKQRTSDLIHNSAAIVSFISQTVTLEPGDLIFTGTPGSTKSIKSGDVVEIELEGVGILSNPVVVEAADH